MKAESRRQKADGRKQKADGSAFRFLQTAFCLLPSLSLPTLHSRRAMTLAELLISMTILAMMSVVLAGMSNAVNSAWSYTKGIEETDLQAQAALERIQYMVSQTGTYKVSGQPTRAGLAVVTRSVGSSQLPDALVLWTGGRSGGMATSGVQSRLPIIGELLIYTWDASTPASLNEVAFPGQTASFDFAASDLSTQVTNLLSSSTAEKIPLCQRLRVSSLSSTSTAAAPQLLTGMTSMSGSSTSMYGTSLTPSTPTASTTTFSSATQSVGNVRFTLTQNPSDTELASAAPQTMAWTQLSWPQSTFGNRSGMRQATLQIELQVEPTGIVRASDTVTAIPFFGSASVRYLYEP